MEFSRQEYQSGLPFPTQAQDPSHHSSYLVPQVLDGLEVGAVVRSWPRGLLLVPIMDLQLQLPVGLLQGAHLVQVAGQPVIEVLHGGFLASHQQPVDTSKATSKATSIATADIATTRAKAVAARVAAASKATAQATSRPQPAGTGS